jgi:hypothetical protein
MDLERRLLRHIGFASTAVGVLLFATSPVLADGNFFSPLTNLITSPFGSSKKKVSTDDGGSTIDYRPRPMLVVPPNNDLPPPHPAIVRSKDWPKDPDANALRKARADSRQLAPAADSRLDMDSPDTLADDSPPPSEPAAPSPPPNCTTIGGMPFCVTTPWGKITLPGGGKAASASGNGDVHLSSTPTRKYLIDPPVTYLVPVQVSESDQKQAAAAEKSKSKCLIPTPGWFGCPANDQ